MADVLLVRRRRRIARLQRYWSLNNESNPFQMRNVDCVERFRLSKGTARALIREVRDVLLRRNLIQPNEYPLELQVLNTLRVLGTGSFQYVLADGVLAKINQSTVCRHMNKIIDAIVELRGVHIRFPLGNEIHLAAAAFYADLGFPNTIGAIDCTHVPIERPPTDDWFTYINRKGKFTINVQMVADSNLKFMNVVPRWPGSAHDSFIWRMCNLRNRFTRNLIPRRTFLLGDSGYPVEPWLMTPYQLSTAVPRERLYNQKHRSARNVVERAFGLLKSRFRCLHENGGILAYSPAKVCKIIMACAILHNLCRERNEADIIEDDDDEGNGDESEEEDVPDWGTQSTQLRDLGVRYRDELAIHFSRNTN